MLKTLKDVEKYAQVYPRDINKATSGFINYNLQDLFLLNLDIQFF